MVPPSMVRVRHPGVQTPAGACAATTRPTGPGARRLWRGVRADRIRRARGAPRLAVRRADDKDWRHGLRVRLLVKTSRQRRRKKKQREERAQRDEGGGAEPRAGTERTRIGR